MIAVTQLFDHDIKKKFKVLCSIYKTIIKTTYYYYGNQSSIFSCIHFYVAECIVL